MHSNVGSDPNYNEEAALETEYEAFFEKNDMFHDNENIFNSLYKVQVDNNMCHSSSMFMTYASECELCGNEHKDNCPFVEDNDDRVTITDLIGKMNNRDLVLSVLWRNDP